MPLHPTCTTPSSGPAGRPRPFVLLVGLVGVVAALVGAGALDGPRPAVAAVEHGHGFAGVVDGFRSWYGSYRLGGHGEVWCVDHAIPAPDAVLAYEPTGLDDRAADTRRAVAWAVGRHGPGADRVTAAALMLVLHDLMGAVYPSGPLSVDVLSPDRLVGFEGHADDVVAAARRIKADAVARAHLVGPMVLTAEADAVAAGRAGELRAALTDVAGAAVEGVVVHPAVVGAALLGDVDRTTDAGGRIAWPYTAGAASNRFDLTATVPGAELLALRPTQGRAQRVVRPAAATVAASTSFDGVVPRRLTIQKRGDAEPGLPVAGARFTVDGREVVAGPDGRTPPVELLPGTYEVTEVESPPGYTTGGPWTVVVHDADVVLEVMNAAVPGELAIEKVTRGRGQPVPGAVFAVRGDHDADPSTFETEVDDASGPLRPGRYELREVEAPPHHRLDPVPRVVEVRGGERAVVRWENVGLATVAFAKLPPLAGAVFVVRAGAEEAGRCTTDADGRCVLSPDVVEAGAPFCWEEVVAPPGWGLAAGGCLAAGDPGSVTTVTVDEPRLPPAPVPQPPALEAAPPAPTPALPATPEPEPAATPAPPPSPPAPEPAPIEVRSAPPLAAPPPELPRTGRPLRRWAGAGLILAGAGLLLLVAPTRPLFRARRRPEWHSSVSKVLAGHDGPPDPGRKPERPAAAARRFGGV